MKKFFNTTGIYILLILLWLLQDVVYDGGSLISKIVVAVFLLLSIIVTLYANVHYKLPPFFKSLNILLALFTIYGFIHILYTSVDYIGDSIEVPSYAYLKNIYISLLPIYVFYFATLKGDCNKQNIQRWTILILLFSILHFIFFGILKSDELNSEEITNNAGYLFVGIISLLVFFRDKPFTQYVLLVVCMVMVFLSMKRGAILVASCSLVAFTFTLWSHSSTSKRFVILAMIIVFLIGGAYFLQHMLLTSDYFFNRLEATKDGNTSLRDELYADLWNHFINRASVYEQLFGGGANHTARVSFNLAHNDWLEILINQGVFGVIIYLFYWISFLKTIKLCKSTPSLSTTQMGLVLCFISSFLMALFSMSYASLPIGLTMTLGICLGQITLFQTGHESIIN